MNKIAVLTVTCCLLTGLTGCQKSEPENVTDPTAPTTVESTAQAGNTSDNSRPDGFIYDHGGVEIVMGVPADPIIEAIGEPKSTFEEASCAFDGIDRTYYYQDMYINTFPDGDTDHVMSVNFLSDAVQTPEGLYVGMSAQQMIDIYGEDYRQEQNMYTYEKNGTELAILTENDEVIQITYYWIDTQLS